MKSDSKIRDDQAARLKQARERAGFKTASAAAASFSWSPSTYMAHENGQNGIPANVALFYGSAFNVDPGWLLTGIGRGPGQTSFTLRSGAQVSDQVKAPVTNGERRAHVERGTADRVPILGMAEAGADGLSLWNGDVVGYAPRPPGLIGVADGYAVYVVGGSMEPRYHPGELVFIHPHKPVAPGCYVLVQMHPRIDGDAPKAFLKRLVRRSGAKVFLEQYEPKKTFELKVVEIASMHRVVASGEA